MRYYLDAGSGGIAVAVHTTQFEIRLPEIDMYSKVLEIAKEEFDRFESISQKPVIRIAGVIGKPGLDTSPTSLRWSMPMIPMVGPWALSVMMPSPM